VALAARISRQLDDLSKTPGLPAETLQRLSEVKTEAAHIGSGFKIS
jgi:hypothetical protein